MNDMELVTDVPVLDMEMEVATRNYPVIPNPEGEPTDDISTMEIDNVIYAVKDETARTELDNKVDKVEGKGLSEEDFTHTLKTKLDGIQSGAEVNVQSDFAQSDNSADDFIKNKPTKLSDFDNDEGFIDNSVNDLENYYKKSETYTKTEINSALDGKADKSDTYTKSEVDSALENKVDKDGDKVLSDNNYSDTDKTKLDGIEAEANKIVVDNSVTATSTNPVESKAIYNLLNDLLPEATETGNPISISNASGFNAKALTVDMLPIQDLHGYDKPWAGGSGKNLVDYSNVTISSGGGFVFNTSFNGESGDYTVSFDFNADGSGQLLFRLYSGSTVVGEKTANYSSGTSRVLATATASQNFDSWRAYVNQSGSVSKIMVAKGSYSTYEPYSNICPISGRTQTEIEVNGETTTVQFGQTVYGGEVDVTSGGTSNIMAIVDLDNLDWTLGSRDRWTTPDLRNVIKKVEDNNKKANIVAEQYETYTTDQLFSDTSLIGIESDIQGSIKIRNGSTTEKPHGKIAYELATPTTINTPSKTISLNKGNNTLSTSGDNMNLKYSKIPQ